MNKFLKWGLIASASLFGVFVLLIVIVVATFSGDTEKTIVTTPVEATQVANQDDSAESAEENEEVEEKKAEEKVAGIGDNLQVGNVMFTVSGRSTATNVGGDWGVNSKGEFLILDVSVQNLGSEAITVDSSFFKLLSDGKVYEADTSAGIYANENGDFIYEQVNPDLTLTGKVVFDIPSEMHGKDLTLQVQTGIFGTEMGAIKLQ